MLNQNRHYWTPPKWLSSSAVYPLDGSLQTIWRLLLWTSGDGVTMRNEPWVWPKMSPGCCRRWGMSGRAARASEVGTDDGTAKKPKQNKTWHEHDRLLVNSQCSEHCRHWRVQTKNDPLNSTPSERYRHWTNPERHRLWTPLTTEY